MNNFKDQRRAGFYFLDSKPYLSVTEVLKVINKPQLMYWFGREVYYAMVKDPTLDEKTAMGAPYQSSGKAKERGSTIHSIVEAYKSSGNRPEFIPDHLQGYVTAFYSAVKDLNLQMIEQEKTVFSHKDKVAGTLDIYATVGGKRTLVDVKTGKDIYQEAGLQLSAYANMMRESGAIIEEIAVLLLETGEDNKPTGKYKFSTMIENYDAFIACKRLYEYLNREKLIKLGYL